MTVILIILWILMAIMACGILVHMDPNEWRNDLWTTMLFCIIAWPFLMMAAVIYFVALWLGNVGLMVAGFLDSFTEEEK